MHRLTPKSPALLALAALLVLVPSAGAAEISWFDSLHLGPGTGHFARPTLDGAAVAESDQYDFHAVSFWVDETGTYRITSDQTRFEPWDGVLLLYAGTFDPSDPLDNLVAVEDDPAPFTEMEVTLVENVVYRLVTTSVEPLPDVNDFFLENRVEGEHQPHFSTCFPVGDEVQFGDYGDSISLLQDPSLPSRQVYCPRVTWTLQDGTTGVATPSPLRTSDSASFWIFDPANLEVHVKVLDGCGVNGHVWVFIGSTTNVGVEIEVLQSREPGLRTYSSAPGTPFQPILDTAAFPCGESPIRF